MAVRYPLPLPLSWPVPSATFAFAIAANVAACASALTGRRTLVAAARESLGYELAAVAAEGGFEPAELVIPGGQEENTEPADKPD